MEQGQSVEAILLRILPFAKLVTYFVCGMKVKAFLSSSNLLVYVGDCDLAFQMLLKDSLQLLQLYCL